MGLGVDPQLEDIARLTPGRTGLEGGAVGHLDGDFVVFGVYVFFHRAVPSFAAYIAGRGRRFNDRGKAE
jgi:hypothetical protein